MRDEGGNPRKGKAMRKGKVSLGIIVTFFVGVIVGMAISISIGAVLSYIDPGTFLTRHPKTFGDIKVWAGKPSEIGCEYNPEVDEMLIMEKDDTPFLTIHKNKTGQISGFHLLKHKHPDEPVFYMMPQNASGKWERATYSRGKLTGAEAGEAYVDIDFDGRFDFNLTLNADGKCISRSILIDGSWQNVPRCSIERRMADTEQMRVIFVDGSWQEIEYLDANNMKAVLGQVTYTFDPNFGWVIHK